jgi:hypothetical protein
MASITFVDCRYSDASFSGLEIVGLAVGYNQGPFGCIFSFTPTVKAKAVKFDLSYTVVSNSRTVYCKTANSANEYDYESLGSVTFTTGAAGSRTASFTITGTFNAGTTYYLFLQSTTSGDNGYIESISGTVTFTAAAPSVYVKVGGNWKQCAGVYVKAGGSWKEAAEVDARAGGVWKKADQ